MTSFCMTCVSLSQEEEIEMCTIFLATQKFTAVTLFLTQKKSLTNNFGDLLFIASVLVKVLS